MTASGFARSSSVQPVCAPNWGKQEEGGNLLSSHSKLPWRALGISQLNPGSCARKERFHSGGHRRAHPPSLGWVLPACSSSAMSIALRCSLPGTLPARRMPWFNLADSNKAPDSHLLTTLPPPAGWGADMGKRETRGLR